MQTATLPFDEIEPVITGHPVVMGFLSGEVEYWTDYEGQPYAKASYVGRADGNGSVEITNEHGALYHAMVALFQSDKWIDRVSEELSANATDAAWGRAKSRRYA